jgi:nucleotide-binding universal stress UspA family protein
MTYTTRHPVVVGVDGSDSARQAVGWAATYAARHGLALRVIHVPVPLVPLADGVDEPDIVRNALRRQGYRWLSDARTTALRVAPGLRVDVALEPEPLAPVLIEESRSAALLVLGTRGLGDVTGVLLGSTATLLAGHTFCPMVVVRDDGTGAVPAHGPTVVGVNGSPDSESAIAFAFADASAHHGHLVAVHTWSDSPVDAVLLDHADAPDHVPAQQRAYEQLAERLAGWQEKYPDVHVTREVVRDHPARALLRCAEGAALVVVGTRGRGRFRGLVLGSTGQRLLHHAPCPVAIVRTEDEGQET